MAELHFYCPLRKERIQTKKEMLMKISSENEMPNRMAPRKIVFVSY